MAKSRKRKLVARIIIVPKSSIPDAVGMGKLAELHARGYTEVESVSAGKLIEVEMSGMTKQEAKRRIKGMCKELLANGVIEDFNFSLEPRVIDDSRLLGPESSTKK